MAALRVGDLDHARRRVNVNQAVAGVSHDRVYGTRKNHSRRRDFERAVRGLVSMHLKLALLSPHDLRHTAASLASSAGANVKAVLEHAGPQVRRNDAGCLPRPVRG